MSTEEKPEKESSFWTWVCTILSGLSLLAACFIPPAPGPPMPAIAWITALWLGGGTLVLLALFCLHDHYCIKNPGLSIEERAARKAKR